MAACCWTCSSNSVLSPIAEINNLGSSLRTPANHGHTYRRHFLRTERISLLKTLGWKINGFFSRRSVSYLSWFSQVWLTWLLRRQAHSHNHNGTLSCRLNTSNRPRLLRDESWGSRSLVGRFLHGNSTEQSPSLYYWDTRKALWTFRLWRVRTFRVLVFNAWVQSMFISLMCSIPSPVHCYETRCPHASDAPLQPQDVESISEIIINLSSPYGVIYSAIYATYATRKSGLSGWSESSSKELWPHAAKVVCIQRDLWRQRWESKTPMGLKSSMLLFHTVIFRGIQTRREHWFLKRHFFSIPSPLGFPSLTRYRALHYFLFLLDLVIPN